MNYAKRRTYLIKKGFQARLIVIILLLVVIVANLTGGVVYGILKTDMVRVWLAKAFTLRADEVLLPAVILAELFSVVIVAFISLFVTHRIAGPVYRFEKVCEEVEAGRLNIKVRLREKDEFKELADSFNTMLRTLEEKFSHMKALAAQVNATVSQMAGTSEKNLTKHEALSQIKAISPVSQELNQLIATFEVSENPLSEEEFAGDDEAGDDDEEGEGTDEKLDQGKEE